LGDYYKLNNYEKGPEGFPTKNEEENKIEFEAPVMDIVQRIIHFLSLLKGRKFMSGRFTQEALEKDFVENNPKGVTCIPILLGDAVSCRTWSVGIRRKNRYLF